jgi:hypothetical protein
MRRHPLVTHLLKAGDGVVYPQGVGRGCKGVMQKVGNRLRNKLCVELTQPRQYTLSPVDR